MAKAKSAAPDAHVSRNIPFKKWCAAKGVTFVTGYSWIEKGLVRTFVINGRRYVSGEEDRAFDRRTRGDTAVQSVEKLVDAAKQARRKRVRAGARR